jgi:Flp pilus assembly pilin Flp
MPAQECGIPTLLIERAGASLPPSASQEGGLQMNSRVSGLIGQVVVDLPGLVRDRLRREEGQAFVEYALVLLAITLVIATAIIWTPLTDGIGAALDRVRDALAGT